MHTQLGREPCSQAVPPLKTPVITRANSVPNVIGNKCRGLRGQVVPIRVAVRLRPLEEELGGSHTAHPAWRTEKGADGQQWVYLSPDAFTSPRQLSTGAAPQFPLGPGGGGASSSTGAPSRSHEGAKFSFDTCFTREASNSQVFQKAARDMIRSSFEGVNSTILAYGQTNSGKTHTILGTLREPGVLPLAVQELFGADAHGRSSADFVAHVSYFEIFNERVIDLLATKPPGESTSLSVKEDACKGFYVQGLSELPVHSADAVLRLISRGEERRRYASTRWNEYSSRSHVLFTLRLEGAPRRLNVEEPLASEETHGTDRGLRVASPGWSAKLSIVDLAGCENQKLEQSEDGRYINRSLFFLGEVISRLCAVPNRSSSREVSNLGDSAHVPSRSPLRSGKGHKRTLDFIPYRDSKLTRILRSSLGGNAVTLLLVTIHPALQFVEPSMTSLRFASKARCIENFVSAGLWGLQSDEPQSTIVAQQRIIEGLQQKLRSLEMERGPHPCTALNQFPLGTCGLPQNSSEDGLSGHSEQMDSSSAFPRLFCERQRQLGQLLGEKRAPASVEQNRPADGGGSLAIPNRAWALPAASPDVLPASADKENEPSPTAFQQVQSRAEDICLRSPKRYIARQQTPLPIFPAPPFSAAGGVAPPPPMAIVANSLPPSTSVSGRLTRSMTEQDAATAPQTLLPTAMAPPMSLVSDEVTISMPPPPAVPEPEPQSVIEQDAESQQRLLPASIFLPRLHVSDEVTISMPPPPVVPAPPSESPKVVVGDSQKELVEKLLYLAVMKINSVRTSGPKSTVADSCGGGLNNFGELHPAALRIASPPAAASHDAHDRSAVSESQTSQDSITALAEGTPARHSVRDLSSAWAHSSP